MRRIIMLGAVALGGLACAVAVGSNAARAQTEIATEITTQIAQATQRQAIDQRYIEVCNRTSRVLNVATAQPTSERNGSGQALFLSRGWYVLQAGQCRQVFGPGLPYRYYYVFGEGYTGSKSGGTFPFCIRKEAFTIKDAQCGQGFNRANFSQIDTSGGKSITYNFTQ